MMGSHMWGYRCSCCYTFHDINTSCQFVEVDKDEESKRIKTRWEKQEMEKLWILKAHEPVPCKAISHCEFYYLTNNLNHHWIRVARQLGFITQEIDDISRQETLLVARAARMLKQWLDSCSLPSETIRLKLVDALRKSHMNTLAAAMIII